MHTQSESHTRKALEAGQNFKSVQEDYSKTFLNEFISLLKSSHGEKEIHANKFYQEVISKRDHTHLNATKWHSLTEFVKYLGRESICRVTEKEDGLFIAWIDDSPEAMKRREAVRRKEMQDKGDEEREHMLLREQIKRAQQDAAARGVTLEEDEAARELKREEGDKVVLSFGLKPAAPAPAAEHKVAEAESEGGAKNDEASKPGTGETLVKPISLKFGAKSTPKNVFKNAFAGAPKKAMAAQPKKMSEAERIMKEEIERKRAREAGGGPPNKRPRM